MSSLNVSGTNQFCMCLYVYFLPYRAKVEFFFGKYCHNSQEHGSTERGDTENSQVESLIIHRERRRHKE